MWMRETFNSVNNKRAFSSVIASDKTKGRIPFVMPCSIGWTPTICPPMTRCNLFPIFRIVSFCKLIALRRSSPNHRAYLLSRGSSERILSTEPSWTLEKSYSSRIGMGADPSRKTRGRKVILDGSDLTLLLQESSPRQRIKNTETFTVMIRLLLDILFKLS